MVTYEEKLKWQKEILCCLKRKELLTGKKLEIAINEVDTRLSNLASEDSVFELFNNIRTKMIKDQSLSEYEIYLMRDIISNMDYEERRKARKSRGVSYGHITRRIKKNEPLTGKTLELALQLVDVPDDGRDFSRFLRNIAARMKAGEPLSDYESHIMIDMVLPHSRLG